MRSVARHALFLPLALSLTSCDSSTSPATQQLVDLVLGFCSSPAFVAYQNEGGQWTPVTPGGSSFTFKATNKVGIAFVDGAGAFFDTQVIYATRAELAATGGTCNSGSGSKTLNGTTNALTAAQFAEISMANSHSYVFSGTTFQINGVLPGALDLVSVRSTDNVPDRVIVRRALNIPDGGSIPILDFGATEAVAPATNTLTISGASGSDLNSVSVELSTATGTRQSFNSPVVGATSATIYGVPASLTATTDIQAMTLFSVPSSGISARAVSQYYRNLADRTATLGAVLNSPTITTASSSPLLMRAQLASQTDYSTIAVVTFQQTGVSASQSFSVAMTSGYIGSTPATWDLQMPNLTGVTGFPAGASLAGGTTEWFLTAADAAPSTLFNETAADGTVVRWGFRASSAGGLLVAGDGAAMRSYTRLASRRRPGATR